MKCKNLKVILLPSEVTKALEPMAARNMEMTCNINGGQVSVFCDEESLTFMPDILYPEI